MRIIDKTLDIPLYIQVANSIREMIETEDLVEGDYLMGERELSEMQGVSRMTANKAIATLAAEGLLIRQQGKGTSVASKRTGLRYNGLRSLSDSQEGIDVNISNEILSFIEIPVTKWIIRKLKMGEVAEGETIYKIRRIRYLSGEPLALESIYLNKNLCPDLTIEHLNSASMNEIYTKHYGYELAQAKQVIRPVMLNDAQAEQLNQPKSDLALRINRRLYTTDGQVVEYLESLFLSQKHDFEVTLK